MIFQELKVSLFANHHSYTNSLVKLSQIVHLIRYDKIIAANTESYRKTLKVMGKKQADTYIKTQLQPAFGVAVTFSGLGHGAAQASQWTGLAMCDIDHFESVEELEAAVERLSKDSHVLLLYSEMAVSVLMILRGGVLLLKVMSIWLPLPSILTIRLTAILHACQGWPAIQMCIIMLRPNHLSLPMI